MSYRQPSKDIGVVKYSAIGEVADKAISSIDAAKTEIITQQKEAQAILDEKFETINDEAATENILQFGIEISDKYSGYIREAASKENIYGLGDQGIRDLKLDLNRMKKSVDKITELASTNIELSKQFDDKDLASFVADFRAGNKDDIDIEFKDGKILYKYKTDTGIKTWSGDDIIKASGKFEDVGIKRDDYNNFAIKVTGATQEKRKEFANQGIQYSNKNIEKDINTAFEALSLNQMSYLYNEVVSDETKSGLPLTFGSRTDKDGRKLSTEEVATIREQQRMLAKDKFKEDYNNRLYQNPLSLDRAIKLAQLDAIKADKAVKAMTAQEYKMRQIENKKLQSDLISMKLPSKNKFPTKGDPLLFKNSKDLDLSYNKEKKIVQDQLKLSLIGKPIPLKGIGSPVLIQNVIVEDDGRAYLYGKAAKMVEENDVMVQKIEEIPLGSFVLDGSNYETVFKQIVNQEDLMFQSRVSTEDPTEGSFETYFTQQSPSK